MSSTSGAPAVACLAAGLLHLFRLLILRRDGAGEAAMLLGML